MFLKTNRVNKSHPADKLIEFSTLFLRLLEASLKTFINSDDVEANQVRQCLVWQTGHKNVLSVVPSRATKLSMAAIGMVISGSSSRNLR